MHVLGHPSRCSSEFRPAPLSLGPILFERCRDIDTGSDHAIALPTSMYPFNAFVSEQHLRISEITMTCRVHWPFWAWKTRMMGQLWNVDAKG